MSEDSKEPTGIKSPGVRKGVVIGAGVGMIFGAAFGNPGVGLVLGAGFGILFGAVSERARKE